MRTEAQLLTRETAMIYLRNHHDITRQHAAEFFRDSPNALNLHELGLLRAIAKYDVFQTVKLAAAEALFTKGTEMDRADARELAFHLLSYPGFGKPHQDGADLVRERAVKSVMLFKDPRDKVIKALTDIEHDPFENVREIVITALNSLRKPSIQHSSSTLTKRALGILSGMGQCASGCYLAFYEDKRYIGLALIGAGVKSLVFSVTAEDEDYTAANTLKKSALGAAEGLISGMLMASLESISAINHLAEAGVIFVVGSITQLPSLLQSNPQQNSRELFKSAAMAGATQAVGMVVGKSVIVVGHRAIAIYYTGLQQRISMPQDAYKKFLICIREGFIGALSGSSSALVTAMMKNRYHGLPLSRHLKLSCLLESSFSAITGMMSSMNVERLLLRQIRQSRRSVMEPAQSAQHFRRHAHGRHQRSHPSHQRRQAKSTPSVKQFNLLCQKVIDIQSKIVSEYLHQRSKILLAKLHGILGEITQNDTKNLTSLEQISANILKDNGKKIQFRVKCKLILHPSLSCERLKTFLNENLSQDNDCQILQDYKQFECDSLIEILLKERILLHTILNEITQILDSTIAQYQRIRCFERLKDNFRQATSLLLDSNSLFEKELREIALCIQNNLHDQQQEALLLLMNAFEDTYREDVIKVDLISEYVLIKTELRQEILEKAKSARVFLKNSEVDVCNPFRFFRSLKDTVVCTYEAIIQFGFRRE